MDSSARAIPRGVPTTWWKPPTTDAHTDGGARGIASRPSPRSSSHSPAVNAAAMADSASIVAWTPTTVMPCAIATGSTNAPTRDAVSKQVWRASFSSHATGW
jgi:hypothetical protein